MIPKTIYQTWYTTNIPGPIQESIDQMKDQNPDYKYVLFDDDTMRDFIQTSYSKQILEIYDVLKVGAAKADLWRYLVLYKYGGIYLDIDSVWKGSFNSIISENDKAVISRENNDDLFVQWCLMFEPGHPILRYAIEKACTNILFRSQDNIVFLTGPIVYSEAVNTTLSPHKIYSMTDDEANKIINTHNMGDKRCKVFSTDYKPHGTYKHTQAESLLYKERPYWHIEQKESGIFH